MADNRNSRKSHFILSSQAKPEHFKSPQQGGGGGAAVPARDRRQHGASLAKQINDLKPILQVACKAQSDAGLSEGFGLQIEFESFPDVELAFESLSREASGIELLNVRVDNASTLATVFVPDGKLDVFEKKIKDYLDESKDNKKSGPKQGKLLNAISAVRSATLDALWTDDPAALPVSDEEEFWWEVWLPVRGDRVGVVDSFKVMAEGLGFKVSPGELQFPERTVLLVYGSSGEMKRSVMTLNSIAELRRAKETASFFDALPPDEQPEWVDDLVSRSSIPEMSANVPHVCILDTGVNNGHPLLNLALGDEDRHTIEPGWGVDDVEGHGTEMAGLAFTGNMSDALSSGEPFVIGHRLESVKLLPHDHANGGDARHHGLLTAEAVSRPEITSPDRRRVFNLAITAKDNRDRGRPSAWSSELDRLASDAQGQGENPRLFIISAGNIDDPNAWVECPNSNSTDGIHDPGQAWNALTVGANTELVDITEPDAEAYSPVAPIGGLSPYSTTSQTWQSHWPLKPDVVFEGGNVGKDAIGAAWMHSLSLLTTNANISDRLFTTTRATSAATALASRMAATILAAYPSLWPESVRALIIHSARWTDAMKAAFLPDRGAVKKSDMARLVRHCGFGVPDIDRALWSIENSLTLVCEDRLHPFKKEKGKDAALRDMNLHRLPWPLQELESLGEVQVEMRVTLSYFIEPNPSARGVTSRYRYESHGLRFDVKRPLESEQDFLSRINAAARDEEERTQTESSDSSWELGKKGRHRGSVHSDIWHGSAAELASRGVIGVYPALGWWKTRHALERYDQEARYSLIVSIHVPEVDVDLYAAVAAQIVTEIEIEA